MDLTSEIESVDDTAALVANLGLVISIDYAAAHLAAALNVPSWVMVDVNPYWTGATRQKHHLVSERQIYRQQRMHRWDEVLEEIRADLSGGWPDQF